jgi:hypothetical protein
MGGSKKEVGQAGDNNSAAVPDARKVRVGGLFRNS